MSKGIIMVDIPADCRDCLLRSLADDCIVGRNVMEYRHNKSKPDWCPIRALPDKLESNSRNAHEDFDYVCGWNDCIDELLKDGG